jgi:TonB family protein
MRKIGPLLMLGILAVDAARSQQQLPPTPDKDGVYRVGPGITSPELVHPVTAIYPPSAWKTGSPRIVVISAVIGIDGVAKVRGVVNPDGSPFESPAVEAVKQSQFQPGLANGSPVPVLVCVGIPFLRVKPAVPWLQPCPQTADPQPLGQPDPFKAPPGATMPVPTSSPEAEFSDEARRKKIQGIVLVSMIVNEKGLPTDIKLVKSVGYGLDESALQAVGEYRFEPATLNGKPIAVRVTVEVNFQLRHRKLF